MNGSNEGSHKKSDQLLSELWKVEADLNWSDRDVETDEGPLGVFSRQMEQLLEKLVSGVTEASFAYGAITGLALDVYTPIASVGRPLGSVLPTRRYIPNSLVAELLSKSQFSTQINFATNLSSNPLYRGSTSQTELSVLHLVGNEELFGYICIGTNNDGGFSGDSKSFLRDAQPIVSRLLADSVFSVRLWEVAKALRKTNGTLEGVYRNITESAARIFGATGAILRLADTSTRRLPAQEIAIAEGADEVGQALISEGSVGESVTQEVFDDSKYGWTVGFLASEGGLFLTGTDVSSTKESALRTLGIRSYCVFRLEASDAQTDNRKNIGTLSIFHCSASRFSWRDIALARSFGQQAANIVELITANSSLLRANTDLLEAQQILSAENKMGTRSEIVSLLAHDLGHKAIASQNAFELFRNSVRKAIRDKLSFNSLQVASDSTDRAIADVTLGLQNINNLFGRDDESRVERFDLYPVVEEVYNTLRDPLERNKCELVNMVQKGTILKGNRGVLQQVLFNMVINAIEAQRTRKNQRVNHITISAARDGAGRMGSSGITMKVHDEGPGIDRNRFSDANDIFKLGESSKKGGTGRGLTISRNLISSAYGGDIRLIDPENAQFYIYLPQGDDK